MRNLLRRFKCGPAPERAMPHVTSRLQACKLACRSKPGMSAEKGIRHAAALNRVCRALPAFKLPMKNQMHILRDPV